MKAIVKQQFDHTDPHLFLVMMMEEEPLLTSMLKAAAYYRKQFPGMLPSVVGAHKQGRLVFKFGDADWAKPEHIGKFTLLDAIYMGLHDPFVDEVTETEATEIPSERTPLPPVYKLRNRKSGLLSKLIEGQTDDAKNNHS